MIHLIYGSQGSGKTILMVKIAYEEYLKGNTIYSNVHFNFPYKPLDYYEIIDCKIEKAVVFIDEIHQLLPARNSMRKINRKICDGFLSMVRKKGLEVYGTTQTLRKVDIRFREEADYIYKCKRYALLNGEWQPVIHNQNLSADIPVAIHYDVIEMIDNNYLSVMFQANPFFELFDTNQIIRIKGLSI